MVVTATNAGGSTKATSAATAVVTLIPPPVDTALPTVSGSPVEGQTLSATTGSWEGSPASYTYQWEDCNTAGQACTNIAKATSSTYKLASTDVGHTLRVIVTATNTGGSTKASSAATTTVTPAPAPPVNTALPTVSGTAVEGQTLSATNGSWEGSPSSYTYQWEDCNTAGEGCANISKATSSTYKLTSTDVGHTLRVGRHRHEHRRLHESELCRDGHRHAHPGSGRQGPAGRERIAGRRPDTVGEHRVLGRQPHLLHLPVGGLQHLR